MFRNGDKLRALAQRLSTVSRLTGRVVSWLVPLLALLVCYDVAMRYLFNRGSVLLQELEWHLFAAIFLLGSAYTLHLDEHVRVDVLLRSRLLGERHRAWVNVLGCLLFLLPFCALVIGYSLEFVLAAWRSGEGSPDPGGLPARWVIKSALPLGFLLLALEGVAVLLRNLAVLLDPR